MKVDFRESNSRKERQFDNLKFLRGYFILLRKLVTSEDVFCSLLTNCVKTEKVVNDFFWGKRGGEQGDEFMLNIYLLGAVP